MVIISCMSKCIKAASTRFPSMIAVAKQPATAAMHSIKDGMMENDASDRNLAACFPLSASSIPGAVNPTDRLT